VFRLWAAPAAVDAGVVLDEDPPLTLNTYVGLGVEDDGMLAGSLVVKVEIPYQKDMKMSV
jgi:hypothetical protein